MDNVVGMLRIRNEQKWIAEVLEALKPACSHLFVLDDHSTDDTAAIAKGCGATVWSSPFEGLDEARDKTWLLGMIANYVPEGSWVALIDGDEVLEAGGAPKMQAAIESGAALAYSMPIRYLWNSREQVRVDGVYGRFSRPSLFQLRRNSMTFMRTVAHGNLHCSSIPSAYLGHCGPCAAELLHLGYMDRADRLRKWEFYNRVDPNNTMEQSYIHVVQGDIPESPADARLRHAGPLELRAL